jgi:hypothetical protein
LRELDSEFEAIGVPVRFIVIGNAEKVATFCGEHDMADYCIADETKATYAAMGFGKYNLLRLLSDKALATRRRENKAAGFSQNWRATLLKDAADLPGAALIDASGSIAWIHRGKHPGDLPPMREMLEIAKALPPLRDLRSSAFRVGTQKV